MSPMPERPILIDARAAVRTEIGGVERWAREMASRLPRLRPSAYRVVRPPRALAHRAGHALREAGHRRARELTWERTAREVDALLARLASPPSASLARG
jgi:hypothetical protein